MLVTPETVVRWHRAGFRLYWSWISRASHAVGRKPISREVRELIFRMVAENPTWGAPRIHGELLELGFVISERTVSRWVKRVNHDPDPARRWLAGSTVFALFLGVQRSATVFHGVREAKVTTEPRAPAPTDLIHCVPSGVVVLVGNQVSAWETPSNQPLAAPTPGM